LLASVAQRPDTWDNTAVDGKLILADGSHAPVDEASIKRALAAGELLWLDFRPADPDGIALLRDDFHLHPLAIEAVSSFGQRPKVEDFGEVIYLVSYGVAGAGNDDLTEVHIFIATNYLITIRQDHCHALDALWERLGRPGGLPTGSNRPTRLILVHHILDSLIDSFFPRLSDFDDHIDELQEKIFARPSNDQLAELFAMQRWLVNVRKLVSPQRDMIAALVAGMVELPGMTADSDPYLRDLYDHTIRISDMIDSYRDLLSNAMDAYLSMVSNNLNVVMKQLAVIATIFLPLSFLTGFFGQNFAWLVGRMTGWPVFVFLGLGTEVLAVAGLYWLFHRRGWIGSGG
jgi:magnesium transporter